MRVDDFDFDLPREMIAERPAEPRGAARMLRLFQGGMEESVVAAMPRFLRPGDVVVFNDTRVIPARLWGKRGEAGIEVTLHQRLDLSAWKVFAKPAKKLRPGDRVDFAQGFAAQVEEKNEAGEVTLRFDRSGEELMAALEDFGKMPLPPYIRKGVADERDRGDYQTVFAREKGAVAAPTAGLHFTPDLLAEIESVGATRVHVTLHVGAGTFLPVKVDDTRDHRMHSEIGRISPEAAAAINRAKASGGRVVAVGTTAARLLESAADEAGTVHPFDSATDIFIQPGYRFRVVDVLMTNFHLPRSTLFMLVSAFMGLERMRAAYDHAKAAGYRFYSYGDSCLLERGET